MADYAPRLNKKLKPILKSRVRLDDDWKQDFVKSDEITWRDSHFARRRMSSRLNRQASSVEDPYNFNLRRNKMMKMASYVSTGSNTRLQTQVLNTEGRSD